MITERKCTQGNREQLHNKNNKGGKVNQGEDIDNISTTHLSMSINQHKKEQDN